MELSWLDYWWVGQGIVIASCFILGLSQGSSQSTRLSPANTKLRFYQFNKKIHNYYIFGIIWTTWVTYSAASTYIYGNEPSEYLVWFLYNLVPVKRTTSTETGSIMLGLLLLLIHLLRRLYESLSISIFSRRQALNIVDLLLSYSFYAAAALSLIADGPELALQQVSLSFLGMRHLLAGAIYILASAHQQQAHRIFAKLRRNRFGHIVTTEYGKPKGDWFEMVSNPHYLAEILIYISIGMVLGANATTWWFLCSYLIIQQISTAYNKHLWYYAKFPDYPIIRKAIIPHLL